MIPGQLILTAKYTNAVLTAILPHFSDFARDAHLAVQLPLSIDMIAYYQCFNRAKDVGGYIRLTNSYSFTFQKGHVFRFNSPASYVATDDTTKWATLTGMSRISRTDSIGLARNFLRGIGWNAEDFFADGEPEVEGPFKTDKKVIPRYVFRWKTPGG